MKYLICLIIGHATGREWFWDSINRAYYRDFRYCSRCGRNL